MTFSRIHKFIAASAGAGLLVAPLQSVGAVRPVTPAIPNAEDAPIALLVDVGSGQTLFAREADRRFVPASITKAMTTFLAFEKMADRSLLPQQVFPMRDETYRKWRRVGSTMFINRGDRLTVDQLLHGVTTVSANDASVVLAEGAAGSLDKWLAQMNAKAREIGMRDSHFGSPNGFPDEGKTWVTANDLAILAQAMIRRHPKAFHHYVGHPEFAYGGIRQPNHDPLIGKVKGADGIKTGFTYQAGFGFLGTAERNGRRLVMVVAGSDSGRARNRAAIAFMEWGFAAFDVRHLFRQDEIVARAQVQDGDRLSVGLAAPHRIAVSVPKGANPKIALSIEYDGPLKAPIRKGERVAQLRIQLNGNGGSIVPLYASEDVSSAGELRRVVNALAGWLR